MSEGKRQTSIVNAPSGSDSGFICAGCVGYSGMDSNFPAKDAYAEL
jgi:hypothetical protein